MCLGCNSISPRSVSSSSELVKVFDLHVLGFGHQMHGPHQVVAGEFSQVHADLAGQRRHAQIRVGRFEMQRLGQVLEFQVARIGAVDGHLSGDVLQLDIRALALQIQFALQIRRAHQVAALQLDARVAADFVQAHVGAVGLQFHAAVHFADIVVAGSCRAPRR
jgi:hypothetical protein